MLLAVAIILQNCIFQVLWKILKTVLLLTVLSLTIYTLIQLSLLLLPKVLSAHSVQPDCMCLVQVSGTTIGISDGQDSTTNSLLISINHTTISILTTTTI